MTALDYPTLAADEETLAVVATTAGAAEQRAVLRLENERLDAIASEGEVLPGGVGRFADFATSGGFLEDATNPSATTVPAPARGFGRTEGRAGSHARER